MRVEYQKSDNLKVTFPPFTEVIWVCNYETKQASIVNANCLCNHAF